MKLNGKIALIKFLYCILIIALHVGFYHEGDWHFGGGSIAVDFFFIVSGYLFINTISKLKYKGIQDCLDFCLKKVKKFFPYVLFLWILAIPLLIVYKGYTDYDFLNGFYCLLFFPMRAVKTDSVFGITWYIIVLIEIETIMFPILLKYKEKLLYYFCPLIILLLGGYIFINHYSLAEPWGLSILSRWGFLRGFFDLNIGIFLYVLINKMKKIKYTKFSRILLTLFEFAGYLSTFYIVNLPNSHDRFDFFMIIVLSICVSISFSEQSYLNSLFNNKFIYYLQKISLPMYINQFLIIEVLKEILFRKGVTISYGINVLVVTVIAIFVGMIELKLIKLYENNSNKIKSLFVKI